MKILLILILLLNMNLFSQDKNESVVEKSILLRHLRINLQADVVQSAVLNNSTDYLITNTFSAGLEFAVIRGPISYGMGAMYQFPFSLEGIKGKTGFLPLYLFIDYPLIPHEKFPVCFALHFGYGILTVAKGMSKVEDGIYHSLGFAFSLSENVRIKIMYAHNYGKIKIDDSQYSLRKGNMSLVLNFNL